MLLEESTTYQAILAKGLSQGISQGISQGLCQGLRTTLLRQGTKRFGPPDTTVLAELHRVTDPERLERMTDLILDATGWDELLAAP